jgi:hypothetical protein
MKKYIIIYQNKFYYRLATSEQKAIQAFCFDFKVSKLQLQILTVSHENNI